MQETIKMNKIRGRSDKKESEQHAYLAGPELYKKIFKKNTKKRSDDGSRGSDRALAEFRVSQDVSNTGVALNKLQNENSANLSPSPFGTVTSENITIKQCKTKKCGGGKSTPAA